MTTGGGVATKFTAPAGGWVNRIWVYLPQQSDSVAAALYSDGGTQPAILLTTSESRTNHNGGWSAFPVPAVAVVAGTDYWVVAHGTSLQIGYETPGASYRFTANSMIPLPTDYSGVISSTADARTYTLYAEICGDPNSTPTPTATPSRTATSTSTHTPLLPVCTQQVIMGDPVDSGTPVSRSHSSTHAQRQDIPLFDLTLRRIYMRLEPQATPVVLRVGVYDDHGGYPGTLRVSSGYVTVTGGVVGFDIPETTLGRESYWLAYTGLSDYSPRLADWPLSLSRTYVAARVMPTTFLDLSATPVATPPPLFNTGYVNIWAEACVTDPGTPTFTRTPTPTPTAPCSLTCTPTFPGTCYVPRLKDYSSPGDTFPSVPGTAITVRGYAQAQGVTVVFALYDGVGAFVRYINRVSDVNGYLFDPYTITGSESFSGNWHVQIFPAGTLPPTSYLSTAPYLDEATLYFGSPTPTPVPTAPCANMVSSFADPGFQVPETHFLANGCHTQYVKVLYPSSSQATLAWYDAAGSLVSAQSVSSSVTQVFSYAFDGSGAPGTWHLTLFSAPATPAPTWPGHAGGLTCGPTDLTVK